MTSKIKEVIKTLFWPVLFGIGQFFICGLFMLVYMLQHSNDDLNSSLLLEYINNQTLLIIAIECIVFIPIFYSVYKNYRMDRVNYTTQTILKLAGLAFLLSTVLNFIIIMIKHFVGISFSNSSITFTTIVATGIIGPILEELLFRGIVYGKFSLIFKDNVAFYLSIMVFAIFHTGGISQIFFAACIGYYLTYIYRKYHDIRLSMLAHICVNMTSILLSPLILSLF